MTSAIWLTPTRELARSSSAHWRDLRYRPPKLRSTITELLDESFQHRHGGFEPLGIVPPAADGAAVDRPRHIQICGTVNGFCCESIPVAQHRILPRQIHKIQGSPSRAFKVLNDVFVANFEPSLRVEQAPE